MSHAIVDMLFTERETPSKQWNKLRFSFVYRGYPCEVCIAPENERWTMQRAPIVRWYNGSIWVDVMLPDLSVLVGPYPGTYTQPGPKKDDAMDAATTALIDYLCRWIDVAVSSKS
jgi:hypothetical protein